MRPQRKVREFIRVRTVYLWKRLRSWTPACNRQWRTEAARSSSPPSPPNRLPSSRTQCRRWCSHLHKKKHTHTHAPRCNHLSNHHWRARYAVWLIIQLGCHLGRRKKITCLKFAFRPDVALKKAGRLKVYLGSEKCQKNSDTADIFTVCLYLNINYCFILYCFMRHWLQLNLNVATRVNH